MRMIAEPLPDLVSVGAVGDEVVVSDGRPVDAEE